MANDNFEARVLMAASLLQLSGAVGRYKEVESEALYDRFLWEGLTIREWLSVISDTDFDFVSLI